MVFADSIDWGWLSGILISGAVAIGGGIRMGIKAAASTFVRYQQARDSEHDRRLKEYATREDVLHNLVDRVTDAMVEMGQQSTSALFEVKETLSALVVEVRDQRRDLVSLTIKVDRQQQMKGE